MPRLATVPLLLLSVILFTLSVIPAEAQVTGWDEVNREGYAVTGDTVTHHDGRRSCFLESKSGATGSAGFGAVAQGFRADRFLVSRVRLSFFVRSRNVEGWAGAWMQIFGTDGSDVGFDNMKARPITGTTEWTQREIVLDAPAQSGLIAFGFLLAGRGQVWADDFKFEIVGNEVKPTGRGLKPGPKGEPPQLADVPAEPSNLDCET